MKVKNKNQFKYSIGIPAKNEEQNIIGCLETVYNQAVLPEYVYVCINGSTDKTFSLVKEYQVNKGNLIILESSPGKMCAIKKILQTSMSEYLMFVDADTQINVEAAYELHKTITTKKVLFAGGSSWRIKPRDNFFTKISDTVFEVVDKQNFLNGKMYMFKVYDLVKVLFKNNIKSIPNEIISDGHFFEKISVNSGGFAITAKAYSFCYPITNFSDWFKFRLRISRGRKQLEDLYPEFFLESDFLNYRVKNYLHRFVLANTFYKKVGSVILPFFKEIINIYVKYLENSKKKKWYIIDSTKKKISSKVFLN